MRRPRPTSLWSDGLAVVMLAAALALPGAATLPSPPAKARGLAHGLKPHHPLHAAQLAPLEPRPSFTQRRRVPGATAPDFVTDKPIQYSL